MSARFYITEIICNLVHNKSAINNQTLTDLHLFYIHFIHRSPTDTLTHTPVHPTDKQ